MKRTGSGSDRRWSRRGFLGLAAWGLAAPGAAACRGRRAGEAMSEEKRAGDDKAARRGRLLARPARRGKDGAAKEPTAAADKEAVTTGEHSLGLDAERDAIIYVPAGYAPERPAPLVVMLHGAGGSAARALTFLRPHADESNLLLLAPQSRAATWDAIRGHYGPDVSFIDRALAHVFARYAVDAKRLAVGGFSDGASYAISLGVTNGDLFTHVLAYSPGFAAPAETHGRPRFYVSHGTRDQVLPIERCSRRLVPELRAAGFEVRYREFDGPHTVPPEITRESVDWFLNKG